MTMVISEGLSCMYIVCNGMSEKNAPEALVGCSSSLYVWSCGGVQVGGAGSTPGGGFHHPCKRRLN